MTLRLRLMIGLVVLTAVGLVVTIGASTLALRSYLFDRVDDRLRRVESLAAVPLAALLASSTEVSRPGLERVIAPTDYLLEVRQADGEIVRIAGTGNTHLPPWPLLESIPTPLRSGEGPPFTVTAGGEQYRVALEDISGRSDVQILIALPLEPVRDTIDRLIFIEGIVGLAVLGATAALAGMLLARGMRPLRDVARTASAIAAGDLSRRVPEGPPRSETGQLGIALNSMLGQIQAAFAARIASQDHLRRFAADASHELRTPLTSIRGYVDLLRGGMVAPADIDDTLRRLQEEATRMGTLVDDLLYLAHLDEQRPLERVEIDLGRIIKDAVADLGAVDPGRPVTVNTPPECTVLGDLDALRQLLGNLLTNARVHTPAGTAVAVRAWVVDGDSVVLEVADRGPGMPPEVAEHVFDRFYRAAGSRARGGRGSGLGLSIVAATASAHGGRAEVRSVLGEGTTFRVYLWEKEQLQRS